MSAEQRVIFKLDGRSVYLNPGGVLSIDTDAPYGIRGLTRKELLEVIKGFAEQVDTINEKLNESLVLLDGIDSAVEKTEVDKCHEHP